jgi:peptidoglycan/LPS O-acetylase OafA/YrhL
VTDLKRIESFDFLKGLAILGVIIVHSSNSFPSLINVIDKLASLGRFGVQLFFLISAINICHTWKLRENEISRIKKFYLRRFFVSFHFFG